MNEEGVVDVSFEGCCVSISDQCINQANYGAVTLYISLDKRMGTNFNERVKQGGRSAAGHSAPLCDRRGC